MSDRELLEMAAKAAGYDGLRWSMLRQCFYDCSGVYWRPLDDDGDALRLAIKLGVDLLFTHEDVEAVATMRARQEDQEMISPWACESWVLKKQDPYAATRRAIVRAAAEIGGEIGQ